MGRRIAERRGSQRRGRDEPYEERKEKREERCRKTDGSN